MNTFSLKTKQLTNNIKNLINSIEIPINITKPLLIHKKKTNKTFYLPIATNKKTLITSTTQNTTTISQSNNMTTHMLQQQILQIPLFVLSNIKNTILFTNTIHKHVNDLQTQINQISNHTKLTQIIPFLINNQIHIHFIYETNNTTNQNMTTTNT